jgi:hypothetical protein
VAYYPTGKVVMDMFMPSYDDTLSHQGLWFVVWVFTLFDSLID